jgi:hypothetical protein
VDITQEQPKVTQTDGSSNHSLMELAVESNSYSTVEVGWMVNQSQFGDNLPHLFVYHFSSGQTTCYNGCGFVQVSTTNIVGEPVSIGATVNYKINYSNGNWYIYYNGDELGYYPETIWSSDFSHADLTQIYGEVGTTSTLCIQMGNGIPGNSSGSAQFSNFALLGASYPPYLYPYETVSSPYSYGDVTATGLNIGGPSDC